MTDFERTNGDRRWIGIDLPDYPEDDFRDIIDDFEGGFPDSWIYNAQLPVDWAPNDALGDSGPQDEITETAYIDFRKGNAYVILNGDLYADAPPEGLEDEAQRVLMEWASAQRRGKSPLPHKPIDQLKDATDDDVPGAA